MFLSTLLLPSYLFEINFGTQLVDIICSKYTEGSSLLIYRVWLCFSRWDLLLRLCRLLLVSSFSWCLLLLSLRLESKSLLPQWGKLIRFCHCFCLFLQCLLVWQFQATSSILFRSQNTIKLLWLFLYLFCLSLILPKHLCLSTLRHNLCW